MEWNANFYDQKHRFVSKYGEEVIGLLNPIKGENILDLGCGTGDLTNVIHLSGAKVIGTDSSKEMIMKAKGKFPELIFILEDARNFNFNETLDAIFSNATLHWILEKDVVI